MEVRVLSSARPWSRVSGLTKPRSVHAVSERVPKRGKFLSGGAVSSLAESAFIHLSARLKIDEDRIGLRVGEEAIRGQHRAGGADHDDRVPGAQTGHNLVKIVVARSLLAEENNAGF